MNDIYLTSTFTNDWNVRFNPILGDAIESHKITCYLPHRDTNQKGSDEEIFTQDISGIKNAKCILAVALNESPNWGAEVGYAYQLNIPIIALTDKKHEIPLICRKMITKELRVDDLDEVREYIECLVELIHEFTKEC